MTSRYGIKQCTCNLNLFKEYFTKHFSIWISLNALCLLLSVSLFAIYFSSGAIGYLIHVEPCVLPDWAAGTFIIAGKDRVDHLWLENLHKRTFAQLFASLPAGVNAHKHGNCSTLMRCFHGYSWKQNKNAYTNVWGEQIKEGCHPSILQIHGSSKKNEYSLVFSKQSYEVLGPPLFVIN